MKAPTAILLTTTVLLGASSVYLWYELAAARGDLDASADVTRRLNAHLSELERLHGSQNLPYSAQQLSVPPYAIASTAPDSASGVIDMKNTTFSVPRVQVDSPAMQRMMRNQARANMLRDYRDLVAQLGLNDEDANKFYDLVSERQSLRIHSDPLDETNSNAFTQRKKEQEIASLIGNSGMQALKEYEQSLGARLEVDQMRDELNAAELPMSDAQRKRLIKAALEEQQQFPRLTFTAEMPEKEIQKLSLAWEREHTERILAQARLVLTTDQYRIYEDVRQSQLEMQEQVMLHPGAEIDFTNGVKMVPGSKFEGIVE